MEANPSDAQSLQRFEEELLQPNVRNSGERVAELLADDFVEFGSSGRVFNKQQIIDALRQEVGTCHRTMDDLRTNLLAPGVVLVTYRITRHTDEGEPSIRLLRSSIWKQLAGRWQMVFHQGTVMQNG
jgi:hypothetical protein